jgi:hypothetical protein
MQSYTDVEINAAQTAMRAFANDTHRLNSLLGVLTGSGAVSEVQSAQVPTVRGPKRRATKAAEPVVEKAPKAPKAPKPAGGKRPRASADEVAALNAEVLAAVKKIGGEVGAGAVLNVVGGKRAAVSRALKLLKIAGSIRSKGEKKNTVYWAV